MRIRKRWSDDDRILACGLYFALLNDEMCLGNPRLVELASLLGRSPDTIHMKLRNFVFLDSGGGLSHPSQADREVWMQFQSHREQMILLSKSKLEKLRASAAKRT